MRIKIIITISCFLVLNIGFSQNKKDSKRIKKEDFVLGKTYAIDTVINGVTYYKEFQGKSTLANIDTSPLETANITKDIPAEKEVLNPKTLKDLPEAAALDQKWLEELYSNALFDTIYKSVTELTYEPIDYPELTTDTLKARLKRLNARTPFNVEYNPSLESVIKRYLKHRRTSLERLMGLSHFYFPMFEQAFDNYNIPLEMKYLSIVESALKPRARSRVGATGLWQFMFGTGKEYKLDVSSYVDERSDPIRSTNAAAKYLARLYKIFGDWDLALAAYNSGPGNVNKAIRRSGGYKNYWNIRPHLPRETAGYVPAFLATMYIFEFAEEHGFKPERPPFQHIQTDTVHVKQMLTLDQVAETTGVNIEELQFLNPSYKLDIIPKIEGKTYALRLPREAIGVFTSNEDKIYAFAKAEFDKREKPLPQLSAKPKTTKKAVTAKGKKTYTVKSGDSLWSIAQKFSGVSVQNLKDWNDISGNKLKIGMTLIVSE